MPETWFVNENSDGSYENWPVTREELDPHYNRVEKLIGTPKLPISQDPIPYNAEDACHAGSREAGSALSPNWRHWP